MKTLKILLWSLFYGLRGALLVALIIGTVLGLLALILTNPWAMGITLLVVIMGLGYSTYKEKRPQ